MGRDLAHLDDDDRRRPSPGEMWYLVETGSTLRTFLAVQRATGRGYELPARDRAEAERFVDGLNRRSLSYEV